MNPCLPPHLGDERRQGPRGARVLWARMGVAPLATLPEEGPNSRRFGYATRAASAALNAAPQPRAVPLT